MAAIAGPKTQLAAECNSLAANTTEKTGQAPIKNALATTAKAASTRSERAASTSAPPGICPARAIKPPAVSTSPMSPCVHFSAVK
jgi:hypothetical protein